MIVETSDFRIISTKRGNLWEYHTVADKVRSIGIDLLLQYPWPKLIVLVPTRALYHRALLDPGALRLHQIAWFGFRF